MAVSPHRTTKIALAVVGIVLAVAEALRAWVTTADLTVVGANVCTVLALAAMWYWLFIAHNTSYYWILVGMTLVLVQFYTLHWWFPRNDLVMPIMMTSIISSFIVCVVWYVLSRVTNGTASAGKVITSGNLVVAPATPPKTSVVDGVDVKLTAEEQAAVQRKMTQHLDLQVAREALNRLQRRLEFHQFATEDYAKATRRDLDRVTSALDWQTSVPPEERGAEKQTVKLLQKYFSNRPDGRTSSSSNDMPPHLVSWVRCHLFSPQERQQRGVRVRPLKECYDELQVKYPDEPSVTAASSEGKDDKTDV